MKLLNNVDVVNAQVQNLRLHFAASPPTAALEGMFYHDSALHRPRWRDTGAWNDLYPFASTNANNTGVLRDASGNFSAGTITAALSGNAATASALLNSRNFSITGKATAASVSFNATGDVALNVTALSVAASDVALTNGYLIIGNGSNVGAATAKNSIALSGFGAATAALDLGNQRITNLATPSADTDAATKAYVDSMAMGFDVKGSARAATVAALPAHTQDAVAHRLTASANGALPAVDGVTLVLNDRVLVKNESATAEHGLYYVEQVGDAGNPWKLKRTTDSDSNIEVTSGLYCWVEEGSTNGDSGWMLTTNNPIVLETTGLTLSQFSGAGQLTMGNGLAKVGNVLHFATSGSYVANTVPFASSASGIGFTANAPAASRRVLVCASGGSPNWSQVALGDTDYVTGTLLATNGGTGLASYTAGDTLYYASGSALTKLAIGSAGKISRSNGTAPTWSTATFPDSCAQYDLLYASGANAWASLTKGAATGALVCSSAGVPTWTTTTTNWNVLRRDGSGNITFGALDISQAGAVTGLLALANGGTGANLAGSAGGLVWTSSATTMAVLAGTGAANKMLLSGASASPTWSTSTHPSAASATVGTFVRSDGTNYANSTLALPNAVAVGELLHCSSANTLTALAAGADLHLLRANGVGNAVSWFDLYGTSATWTGTQRMNPGTTPSIGLELVIDAMTGAGRRDSHSIRWVGRSFDTLQHTAEWFVYVDMLSNAGANALNIDYKFDAGPQIPVAAISYGGAMTLYGTGLVFENGSESLVSAFAGLTITSNTGDVGSGGLKLTTDGSISGTSTNIVICSGNATSTSGNVYIGAGDGAVADGTLYLGHNGTAPYGSVNLPGAGAPSRALRLDASRNLANTGYDIPAGGLTAAGRFLIAASVSALVESSYTLPTGALTANQLWLSTSTTAVTPTSVGTNTLLGGNGSAAFTTYTGTAGQVMRCSGTVPGFGSIDLSLVATVGTSVLQFSNGGTGSAYFEVTGLSTRRVFTFPDASSTIPRLFAATVTGNGVATTLDVAHNFATRDIHVQVWETAGSYDQVYPDLELPDTNTARLRFLTPPTNGYTYRVVIIGR